MLTFAQNKHGAAHEVVFHKKYSSKFKRKFTLDLAWNFT